MRFTMCLRWVGCFLHYAILHPCTIVQRPSFFKNAIMQGDRSFVFTCISPVIVPDPIFWSWYAFNPSMPLELEAVGLLKNPKISRLLSALLDVCQVCRQVLLSEKFSFNHSYEDAPASRCTFVAGMSALLSPIDSTVSLVDLESHC